MGKLDSTIFGLKQQERMNGRFIFRLKTQTDTFNFTGDAEREQFIRDQGIVMIETRREFARLPKPTSLFSTESLTRTPKGRDDPEILIAKRLARASVPLWMEASQPSRDWWHSYCQMNADRTGGLLELANGLNHLEARYRRGGGLPAVDWLAELRKVAFEKRWSGPDELLEKVSAGFMFEEE